MVPIPEGERLMVRAWIWRQQPEGTTIKPHIVIEAIEVMIPVPNWANELDVEVAGKALAEHGYRLADLGTAHAKHVEFAVEPIDGTPKTEADHLRAIVREALEAAQQVHIHASAGEGARTRKLIDILRRGLPNG